MGSETSDDYRTAFDRDGFVIAKNAITLEQLKRLRAQLSDWVETSRHHSAPFGQTIDGRPRFDIEPGSHGPDSPALRRVAAPIEVSEAFLQVARDNAGLDLTADLLSPNIKLYATKVNLKLPGSGTTVKFHQDFPFDPHSNKDVMTALYFLDDVTLDNGPLEVVPGSHKGPTYSLWQGGVFTGAVAKEFEKQFRDKAVKCTGKAGDACLMHSNVMHGSLPNLTGSPRSLFIVTYAAEDAVALVPNPIPHRYDGEIVRGAYSGRVRTEPFELELPEHPKTASFFDQQALAES